MVTEVKKNTTYETKVIVATLDSELKDGVNIVDINGVRCMIDTYNNRVMPLSVIYDLVDVKYNDADSDSSEETAFALIRNFLDQFFE